jgi:NIMA-interacting peptidyl-prolyl cis-trans isomerase 1
MRSSVLLFLAAVAVGCDDKSAVLPPAASASTVASSPSAPPSAPSASAPSAPPSATGAPSSIAAQHVLVAYRGAERAPPGVTRSKADAKARAVEVDAKAKAGEDFSALVAEYSDDPGAKDRQGSLGKFTRDKMDKAFSDAAFALRVGEISDVVETRFGFHVIKRNQ